MKNLIQQRINDYTKYFNKNIPYFNKDGTVLTELNFDFEKLSDEFLGLYEEAVAKGEADDALLKESTGPKGDLGKLLEKVKLQDEDFRELLKSLKDCTVFKGSLNIVNQKISDETLIAIGNILRENTVNIEKLDLSDNPLLNRESGIALGEALRVNKTLKFLSIKKNDLRTEGNNRIIEALSMNDSLIELELGVISDESLGYLADFLAKNSSVKNIAFEEDPKSPWNEKTVSKFIATLRSKKNPYILSCEVKPLSVMKQRMFLGEIALICEKNRRKELSEFENRMNEGDTNDNEYYTTEE